MATNPRRSPLTTTPRGNPKERQSGEVEAKQSLACSITKFERKVQALTLLLGACAVEAAVPERALDPPRRPAETMNQGRID
jgi:hypothetical protein